MRRDAIARVLGFLPQECPALFDYTVEQVAALALFLCGDNAAQITGANLSIDGAPLLNLATSVPLWRDLGVGDEGADALALRAELIKHVRTEIGPIAAPDVIQWAPGLPKTRSGKIMRRILRKIAENEIGSLGDTSTLADPSVVDDLVKNRAGA